LPQSPPQAPDAPVVAVTPRATPSASAIYEGFKAQQRELSNQLEDLESTRQNIANSMEEMSSDAPGRKALEERMTDINARIKVVDQQLAANATQLAQAAAFPGAVVQPPPIVREGPPEEAFVLGGIFMFVVLLPISIAFARRIWRRSAAVVTSMPRELIDRLTRLEQTVEASSFEIERIGEGQRFLTKLFTEGEVARQLGGGATPVKQLNARESKP
jgi:hypothetical protein